VGSARRADPNPRREAPNLLIRKASHARSPSKSPDPQPHHSQAAPDAPPRLFFSLPHAPHPAKPTRNAHFFLALMVKSEICVTTNVLPMLVKMSQLEEVMNRLTDMDGGWWPILFLRPPKNEEISNIILLQMTSFFGPASGLVALLFLLIDNGFHSITFKSVCFCLLFGCLGFFILYKFTFAYFWNCRARRLKKSVIKNEPVA